MKKFLCFFLALMLCLSLCACGRSSVTKDEMIAIAEPLDCITIISDYESNPYSAKDKYTGKVFTVAGYIEDFSSSYVTIVPIDTPIKSSSPSFKVYMTLDDDEIKKLSSKGAATFVGQVSDVTDCYNQIGGVGLHMKGYYVNDTVSFEGNVEKIYNFSTNGVEYPYIMISNFERGELTYYGYVFYDGESIINNANISEGDNITITGQMEYDYYTTHVKSKNYIGEFRYNVRKITAINKK